jgi:cycloartenol synthase
VALALLDPKRAGPAIPPERLYDAVNVILSYQNR